MAKDRSEIIAHLVALKGSFNRFSSPAYPSVIQDSIEKRIYKNERFKKIYNLLSDIIEIHASILETDLEEIHSAYSDFVAKVSNAIINFNGDNDLSFIASTAILDFDAKKRIWHDRILPELTEHKFTKLRERQSASNAELTKTINEINETYQGLSKQVADFNNRYVPAIAKLESLYQQDKFVTEAKRFQRIAYIWLVVSVVGGIALVYFSYQFFLNNNAEWSFYEDIVSVKKECPTCFDNLLYLGAVKSLLFRILVVSLIVFAISFSVKNYNAQMHNYAVNLHKSNSLYASGILMNNAQTPESKAALTINAANAIFQQHATGYNGKDLNLLNSIMDKVRLPQNKNG